MLLMEGKRHYFLIVFRQINSEGWNQRLGHPQQQIVDHAQRRNLISFDSKNKSFQVCSSCQMEKSRRLPFLPVNDEIESPFYKIHCEL